jgi:hypothetical protein
VVAGYRGSSSWKEFTLKMRDTWRNAGFGVAAMFESTIDRALQGYAAGVADGKTARAAWRAIGMPDDCLIAYAVDTNVNATQIAGPIADYFRGVASVDTCAPWAYIENDGIKYLVAHHLIDAGFQPAAWGWGNPAAPDAWDDHAYWKQEHNGVSLHGGDVDTGHITDTSNFWRAPGSPPPIGVDDVQLTDTIHLVQKDDVTYSSPTSTVEGILASISYYGLQTRNHVDALAKAVATLPTTSAPVTCNCPTIADIKAAIKAEIESIKVTAV